MNTERDNQTANKICDVWQKIWNPLRGLNTFEIERMLNLAR